MFNRFNLALLIVGTLVAGCDSSSKSLSPPFTITPPPDVPPPQQGVLGAPIVVGLRYETDTQTGTTNAEGQFNYRPNEQITFYFGDLQVGDPVLADSEVRVFDLFNAAVPDSVRAYRQAIETNPPWSGLNRSMRFLELMHSVDEDAVAENGLTINPETAAVVSEVVSAYNLDLDAATELHYYQGWRRIMYRLHDAGLLAARSLTKGVEVLPQYINFTGEVHLEDTFYGRSGDAFRRDTREIDDLGRTTRFETDIHVDGEVDSFWTRTYTDRAVDYINRFGLQRLGYDEFGNNNLYQYEHFNSETVSTFDNYEDLILRESFTLDGGVLTGAESWEYSDDRLTRTNRRLNPLGDVFYHHNDHLVGGQTVLYRGAARRERSDRECRDLASLGEWAGDA